MNVIVWHSCVTFFICHQLVTPQDAEVHKTGEIGMFLSLLDNRINQLRQNLACVWVYSSIPNLAFITRGGEYRSPSNFVFKFKFICQHKMEEKTENKQLHKEM